MKLCVRFSFAILIIMSILRYWLYSINNNSFSPQLDVRENREQLYPVNVFGDFIWSGIVSGSLVIGEFYPFVTWYLTLSGHWSWAFNDSFIFSYHGTVNQKKCRIDLKNLYTWIRLTISGCHAIWNKEHWKVLMYIQEAIDRRGSQWRIIDPDHRHFMFFLYPWGLLTKIADVVSSEWWKCTKGSCLLFIDKDLLHSTWSKVPSHISHQVDLEIENNGILEIHDRDIDDGLLNWYIKNNAFELMYKRWWLFKRMMYAKWELGASAYKLLFTIGKWLRRELILHRSWNTLSGSIVSSEGTHILIW